MKINQQGWRVVQAEECWHRSLEPLMAEVRQQVRGFTCMFHNTSLTVQIGTAPCYLSFDIDAIDPGFCPGTGTPEIGGLTTIQVSQNY